MELISVLFSVITSSFAVGFLIPTYLEMKRVEKELRKVVVEFQEIARIASDANASFASKILQLEEKISSLEWKTNFTKK